MKQFTAILLTGFLLIGIDNAASLVAMDELLPHATEHDTLVATQAPIALSQEEMILKFIQAARDNDIQAATECLQQGVDINSMNKTKSTALIAAIMLNSDEMIDFLLEHNADINIPESYSPLMIAASGGNYDIVHRLLDAGARYNADEQLEMISCPKSRAKFEALLKERDENRSSYVLK